MKKTLTVNLGGRVYHIDEDAYRLLDDYLENLRLHFRKQQGADEIVNDIESRVAELFAERLAQGREVVTVADVEEVIARMGRPEELDGAGDDACPPPPGSHAKVRRRLYRDPDDRMLGGVAAGLAAYWGWDPTWVRLLMALLIFVPYCPMIVVYLVLWAVIPLASTASERLSMRGMAVTVENIGKTVTGGFERVSNSVNDYVASGRPRSLLRRVADFLLTLIVVLAKVILVLLAVVLCPVILIVAGVLLIALTATAMGLFGAGAAMISILPAEFVEMTGDLLWSGPWIYVGGIVGALFAGIPLFALLYSLFRFLFKWKPLPRWLHISLWVAWILSVMLLIADVAILHSLADPHLIIEGLQVI